MLKQNCPANKHTKRELVIDFLQKQLNLKTKTVKKTFDNKMPLSDSDIKRIEKEIEILKAKL